MAKAGDILLRGVMRGAFGLLRLLGRRNGPRLGAAICRRFGPWSGAHRIGLANVRAAFPERDEAFHQAVLKEAWDNLGRTVCEYVHMDAIWDFDPENPRVDGNILIAPEVVERFLALREDGKPALLFASHLANWELPAIAAAKHQLHSAVLYRTPNNKVVAGEILALRRDSMGTLIPAGLAAPFRLAQALEEGAHAGMLVDQRFGRGPRIQFLGREATANPLIAQLARRFDCPVHGARAIRLPNGRFRLDLTPEIDLPRDAEGKVDIDAACQVINDVVGGWIREHPGQWLWMHRRWRL